MAIETICGDLINEVTGERCGREHGHAGPCWNLSVAARQIADALTPAQRDAMMGRFLWLTPMEEDDGEAGLYRLGIWGPHGGRSPLARAVRAIIQEQNNG